MEALAQLLPFVVIVALFWLLLIRPAQRRQRQAVATQRSAQVGSEVILSSGIFGTVVSAADDTLQVEIAPGTAVRVARGAIANVLGPEPSTEPSVNDEAPGAPEGQ